MNGRVGLLSEIRTIGSVKDEGVKVFSAREIATGGRSPCSCLWAARRAACGPSGSPSVAAARSHRSARSRRLTRDSVRGHRTARRRLADLKRHSCGCASAPGSAPGGKAAGRFTKVGVGTYGPDPIRRAGATPVTPPLHPLRLRRRRSPAPGEFTRISRPRRRLAIGESAPPPPPAPAPPAQSAPSGFTRMFQRVGAAHHRRERSTVARPTGATGAGRRRGVHSIFSVSALADPGACTRTGLPATTAASVPPRPRRRRRLPLRESSPGSSEGGTARCASGTSAPRIQPPSRAGAPAGPGSIHRMFSAQPMPQPQPANTGPAQATAPFQRPWPPEVPWLVLRSSSPCRAACDVASWAFA